MKIIRTLSDKEAFGLFIEKKVDILSERLPKRLDQYLYFFAIKRPIPRIRADTVIQVQPWTFCETAPVPVTPEPQLPLGICILPLLEGRLPLCDEPVPSELPEGVVSVAPED